MIDLEAEYRRARIDAQRAGRSFAMGTAAIALPTAIVLAARRWFPGSAADRMDPSATVRQYPIPVFIVAAAAMFAAVSFVVRVIRAARLRKALDEQRLRSD